MAEKQTDIHWRKRNQIAALLTFQWLNEAVASMEADESERCSCCELFGPCSCDIELVDDSDPASGYFSQSWYCFTHRRQAQ
jgi:hypothetical protein